MASRKSSVAYVWQFDVKPDCVDAFREAYGPKGVWAIYYSQSKDYLGTDLYEDRETAGRFLTVDYFSNGVARGELVASEADAFAKIDDQWEHATKKELYIGQFNMSTDFAERADEA